MFHEPRSEFHWALRVASPFACCAPPRRKECEVKFGVGFALVYASLADLTMRLMYACIFMLYSLVLRFFVRGSLEVSGPFRCCLRHRLLMLLLKGYLSV
ncbi:hypothetical protein PHMEG_00038982 [Phytophthora megakarya]|uniref:Uncharacterized protein n=1 Tax=Phytophthora megakarya TaxID=4795 RepID=A0A225UGC1_9STRA|nr:hypothetical protein PHMEG_00038982 [Phytophthora megakarya]